MATQKIFTLSLVLFSSMALSMKPEAPIKSALSAGEQNELNDEFIFAAKIGNTKMVKALLENKNIQVNALIEYDQLGFTGNNAHGIGRTALIEAAINGHTEIVKVLLDHKDIQVNVQDKYDKTALMWAAINGHTEIVKTLLDHKDIQVNIQSKTGMTALMYAAGDGHKEIVKALLNHKIRTLPSDLVSHYDQQIKQYGWKFAISKEEAEKALIDKPETCYRPSHVIKKFIQDVLAARK